VPDYVPLGIVVGCALALAGVLLELRARHKNKK
jgi:hypothetical protein